ncbi:hypothetical protein [Streptomyces sp. NPDC000405]|uniref:hypothetical protein n=1 Tax=Streptomyces sp. NPDC000405 TaxID=3161033 RepID=UPI00398D3196
MTRRSAQDTARRNALHDVTAWVPGLGDLAYDTTRRMTGVVVALPAPDTPAYHLRPLGPGSDWSVPFSSASLKPLPEEITHVSLGGRDIIYDHRAHQAALPVQLHHADGTATESALILTPGQVELLHLQFEQAISKRREAVKKDAEESDAADTACCEGGNR